MVLISYETFSKQKLNGCNTFFHRFQVQFFFLKETNVWTSVHLWLRLHNILCTTNLKHVSFLIFIEWIYLWHQRSSTVIPIKLNQYMINLFFHGFTNLILDIIYTVHMIGLLGRPTVAHCVSALCLAKGLVLWKVLFMMRGILDWLWGNW